jgi:DNA modification methylase
MVEIMITTILLGSCLSILSTLPNQSINTCVTSPPYYGLRDYGIDGQLGLEPTPEEYVADIVRVFREVRRVLRDDGTLWLNLGDSYAGAGAVDNRADRRTGNGNGLIPRSEKRTAPTPDGLKPKNLIGIPWRVAFALQADDWYLRQDIIWNKLM